MTVLKALQFNPTMMLRAEFDKIDQVKLKKQCAQDNPTVKFHKRTIIGTWRLIKKEENEVDIIQRRQLHTFIHDKKIINQKFSETRNKEPMARSLKDNK